MRRPRPSADRLICQRSGDPALRGFTLFEVAISLLLVAVGVLSVLMLFPVGLKAQLNARYQLFAAVKAEEMVEAFAQAENSALFSDTETPTPWDAPIARRNQAPDLECKLGSPRYGVWPLPTVIARRIDSDADEIKRIIDEGGQLYYSQPLSTSGSLAWTRVTGSGAVGPFVANESQKLVFAVTGYAQHNAIASLPAKRWPYHTPYPSPPIHVQHLAGNPSPPPTWNLPAWAKTLQWPRQGGPANTNPTPIFAWESAIPPGSPPGTDPDMEVVFNAYMGDPTAAALPYRDPTANTLTYTGALPAPGNISYAGAERYLQATLWYCLKKNAISYLAPPTVTPTYFDGLSAETAANAVRSMRFLAHAALCMTRWKTHADLGLGIDIPGNPAFPDSGSPPLHLTHDLILAYHECSLQLACVFAASFPYDWSVPRPLNRVQMMDYPLIEYDLFTRPRTGRLTVDLANPISGGFYDTAQWKPLPATAVSNPWIGMTYPDPVQNPLPDAGTVGSPAYDGIWASRTLPAPGPPDHVTLTTPFDPAERCREIVFWAVDWQSYTDAESAPSAVVEASRYPFRAPFWKLKFDSSQPNPSDMPVWGRMDAVTTDELDAWFCNPERFNCWTADVTALGNGATPTTMGSDTTGSAANTAKDIGKGQPNKEKFNGLWGADRNLNGRLDRGAVKPTVRMRALEVARLLYYDPRVTLMLR